MRKKLSTGLLLFLLGFFVAACASSTVRETEALLAQQYLTMNNDDLLRYYLQLNDQIARVERPSAGTGVGLGIGTGIGSRSGVGVGVSRGVTRSTIAEDLRGRRNDVRVELSRRRIQP